MTLLEIPAFYIVIAIIAIVTAILVIPSCVYAYFISKPTAKEREEYAKAIQEGLNEANIDFAVKHPRAHCECPYDLQSCDYVDTSTMTISKQCQDCERFDNGVRPSKI